MLYLMLLLMMFFVILLFWFVGFVFQYFGYWMVQLHFYFSLVAGVVAGCSGGLYTYYWDERKKKERKQ